MAASEPTARRSHWPLWLMVTVFALPVVAGWLFHFRPELLPATRANRGELIAPVRPWPAELVLTRPDGSRFAITELAGRWVLVTAAAVRCDARCVATLAELRQVRLAAGEGGLAVERLLLLVGDDGTADLPPEVVAGAEVARAGSADAPRVTAFLGPGDDVWSRVYIVDPLGNLMMRYAADAPAKDVLKDTERLLKASRNWIKGAGYGHR